LIQAPSLSFHRQIRPLHALIGCKDSDYFTIISKINKKKEVKGAKMQQNGGISNYSPKKTAKMFGLHHISDDLLCDSDKNKYFCSRNQ
jgi:hypothetical protein